MAFSKLFSAGGAVKKRDIEAEDIRQAFLRVARNRWGEDVPLGPKSVRGGVIKVEAPSAPWQSALSWASQEILEEINSSFGENAVKKIIVWWN